MSYIQVHDERNLKNMYQTDMHKSSESCSTKYSACVWFEKAQLNPPLELNIRHLDFEMAITEWVTTLSYTIETI